MQISIARDGNVLGDYPESEIPTLIRDQFLQPTDLYWHDGLPEWQPLMEYIGPEPALAAPELSPALEPSPTPKSDPPPQPLPGPARAPAPVPQIALVPNPEPAPEPDDAPPARLLPVKTLAGLGVALALAAAAGAYFYFRGPSPVPVEAPPAATATPGTSAVPPTQATPAQPSPNRGPLDPDPAAQLRADVANLQKPPPDIVYEEVTQEIRSADSPYATHVGIISGRELILNHETRKTAFVLEFIVTLGFQNGEWFYDHATGTFYATSDYKRIAVAEDFRELRFMSNVITTLQVRPTPRIQPP